MEKPILFNTEMVKAILEGRKTVTRRKIKRTPSNDEECGYGFWKAFNESDGRWYVKDYTHSPVWWTLEEYIKRFSKYQVGDILWVRETWCELCHVDENYVTHYDQTQYYYKTDGDYQIDLYDDDGHYLDEQKIKWHPSIHMPKSAARIFLEVTDVRIERLQEITEDEAEREGISIEDVISIPGSTSNPFTVLFEGLWDSTVNKKDIGKYGWEANPFVWVVEFERVEKTC